MESQLLKNVDSFITKSIANLKHIAAPLTTIEINALRSLVLTSVTITIIIVAFMFDGFIWKFLLYFICILWFMCLYYYYTIDAVSRQRIDSVIFRISNIFKSSLMEFVTNEKSQNDSTNLTFSLYTSKFKN